MDRIASEKSWKESLRHHRFDQMIAGILSGGTSTCILHPLDLVKTQFQIQTIARSEIVAKPWLYTFRHLSQIYKRFGLRKGLYQGLSANLAGSTASWGLYFFLYDWTKSFLPSTDAGKLSSGNYFLASSSAAATTVLFTNPLWMIKTRLCLQNPENPTKSNYRGLFDAFVRISREEGIRGLYRGLIPGLFGVSHGAIQFMAYEGLKNYHHETSKEKHIRQLQVAKDIHRPSNLEYLFMSSSSKVIAMLITYPYQVVRARLQARILENNSFSYKGVLDVICKTAKREGLWAFYRGIIPSTFRVLPGTCITFIVYEKVSEYLKN
jgi:solute carrier family 25 (mitochondrial folate transporter), member 32